MLSVVRASVARIRCPPPTPLLRRYSHPLLPNPGKRDLVARPPQETVHPIVEDWHNISDPKNKVQIYESSIRDPFVNLAFEHALLKNTPPDSVVLFLYRNDPSIIIGRNQNPWTEINLEAARAGLPDGVHKYSRVHWTPISIVRRRSGGGTVFHDPGNVNWSVIVPTSEFTRDKHAHMIVRALQQLGVKGARVNDRHDIVLDKPDQDNNPMTYKVSGSAYKLTRLRSLHHGTMLLKSENLHHISRLLKSPAIHYIKSRGVESVPSPVCNVDINPADFIKAVKSSFAQMYGPNTTKVKTIGKSLLEVEEIEDGVAELQSNEWLYEQTPQFTFSSHPHEDDPREREPPPNDFKFKFTARHGIITDATFEGLQTDISPRQLEALNQLISSIKSSMSESMPQPPKRAQIARKLNGSPDARRILEKPDPLQRFRSLVGVKLADISDWRIQFGYHDHGFELDRNKMMNSGKWLNHLLGPDNPWNMGTSGIRKKRKMMTFSDLMFAQYALILRRAQKALNASRKLWNRVHHKLNNLSYRASTRLIYNNSNYGVKMLPKEIKDQWMEHVLWLRKAWIATRTRPATQGTWERARLAPFSQLYQMDLTLLRLRGMLPDSRKDWPPPMTPREAAKAGFIGDVHGRGLSPREGGRREALVQRSKFGSRGSKEAQQLRREARELAQLRDVAGRMRGVKDEVKTLDGSTPRYIEGKKTPKRNRDGFKDERFKYSVGKSTSNSNKASDDVMDNNTFGELFGMKEANGGNPRKWHKALQGDKATEREAMAKRDERALSPGRSYTEYLRSLDTGTQASTEKK